MHITVFCDCNSLLIRRLTEIPLTTKLQQNYNEMQSDPKSIKLNTFSLLKQEIYDA